MGFTIGNICKEVQRIQFDIENKNYKIAIERCKELDALLCEIEEGICTLVIEDEKIRRV